MILVRVSSDVVCFHCPEPVIHTAIGESNGLVTSKGLTEMLLRGVARSIVTLCSSSKGVTKGFSAEANEARVADGSSKPLGTEEDRR